MAARGEKETSWWWWQIWFFSFLFWFSLDFFNWRNLRCIFVSLWSL